MGRSRVEKFIGKTYFELAVYSGKNMNTLEFSHSYKSYSLSNLPFIKRPKLD
nr:hypothetical protein [uncultured Chryseobacterium sp.]